MKVREDIVEKTVKQREKEREKQSKRERHCEYATHSNVHVIVEC